jgi:hypothetical protein
MIDGDGATDALALPPRSTRSEWRFLGSHIGQQAQVPSFLSLSFRTSAN